MGFLPWVGFVQNDTFVYLQNERGIWRISVPEEILENVVGTPFVPGMATPEP